MCWWLFALLTLNALGATGLFIAGGGAGSLGAPGGLVTALGRLTGLYGALGLVSQLVLIARVPWLERRLGMDQLTLWHRWTGFWVLWLLLAHVVFITLGYAGQDRSPVLAEVGTLLFDTHDVLKAAVAMVLLVGIAVTSARAARRRVHYETCHFVHLYAYLAVVLGFLQQITVGRDFIGAPLGRLYWWWLYGTALGAVLVFRVLVPLWRGLHHHMRVLSVVPEGPDVVSVYIGGRRLDKLAARAGQFFLWRFLTRDRWWQAHPYSLSAMPDGKTFRITGSAGVAQGCGGFAPAPGCSEEMQLLARQCSAPLHVVTGPSTATGRYGPTMGPRHLAAMVPGIQQRDVYLCGPPSMTDTVLRPLDTLGVPATRCHTERFAFAT